MFPATNDWKKLLVTVAVFLFPALCISLEHAGSTLFGILLILGLVYGWQGWGELAKDEKQYFLGLLCLFAVIAVGLFYTVDVKEGLSKLERYLRILLLIPVYLMVRRFQLNLGRQFVYGAILAVPVLLLTGLYQTEILDRPVASGAYHKIVYGDTLILFCSIAALAIMNHGKDFKHYLLTLLLVIAGVYGVILSDSRGALLFVPLIIIVVVFLQRKKISSRAWKIGGASIVLTILLVIFLQPANITGGIKRGLGNFELYQEDPSEWSSWGARLNFWRNSLIMFSESPVLGKGTGSYQAENVKLVEKGISHADYVVRFGHAHSIYFHTLAENGLVGMVVMIVAIIILPFRYFYRRWKIAENTEQELYTLAGIVSVFAFAWFGVSEMWLARNPFVNIYFMCMLIFMSSTSRVFAGKEIDQKKT